MVKSNYLFGISVVLYFRILTKKDENGKARYLNCDAGVYGRHFGIIYLLLFLFSLETYIYL